MEKTLASAAETYADDETVTALAQTVSDQWKAYQENPEGYFDSVELMELDTMIGGKAINDFDLVKTLCENTAPAIDWLEMCIRDSASCAQRRLEASTATGLANCAFSNGEA